MAGITTIEAPPAGPAEPKLYGLIAEYETPHDLIDAAERVRDAGFTRWDCMTPFPVHGLDRAMGMRKTVLPWIVLVGGVTGLIIATALQWYVNSPHTQSSDLGVFSGYPLRISGKPFWSLPANIPVMFELTVLFSALTAFFGLWVLIRLPRYYHPVFNVARFRRVTDDRFFVFVEACDPKFDPQATRELLSGTHTAGVEEVMD